MKRVLCLLMTAAMFCGIFAFASEEVVVCNTLSSGVHPETVSATDLALNKTASVTDEGLDPVTFDGTNVAANIVDGMGTSSRCTVLNIEGAIDFVIDLSATETFNKVEFTELGHYILEYELQASEDNTTWKTLVEGSSAAATGGWNTTTKTFPEATARYFRLHCTQLNQNTVILYEIKIFNDLYAGINTPVDLSSYYTIDTFMAETDSTDSMAAQKTASAGKKLLDLNNTEDKKWMESEVITSALNSNGYYVYDGKEYDFGSLGGTDKNAFLANEVTPVVLPLNDEKISGLSIIASGQRGDCAIPYIITYSDDTVEKGSYYWLSAYSNSTNAAISFKNQIRYNYSDSYPGYWKVSNVVTGYFHNCSIALDGTKEARSISFGTYEGSRTANWDENKSFIFAITKTMAYTKAELYNRLNAAYDVLPAAAEDVTPAVTAEQLSALQSAIAEATAVGIDLSEYNTELGTQIAAEIAKTGGELLVKNADTNINENTVSFTADVYNFSDAAVEAVVIVVIYKDGELSGVKCQPVTVEQSIDVQRLSTNYTPTETLSESAVVKAFVWNSLNQIKPFYIQR